MRKGRSMPRVKRVRAKGRDYYYFDTGTKNEAGKPILKRLPDISDRRFGAVYAAMQAHVSRRMTMVPRLTVSGLIDLYQRGPAYRALKPASQRNYDLQLRKLNEAVGNAGVDEIERRDVIALLDSLADRPATANIVLAVFRALYKWGRDRGHASIDPARDIDPFDVGEHDPWPEQVLAAALEAEDRTVRLMVAMLYYTAQRVGDVCRMRWSDIRDGRFYFTQEKTGKDMSVPVHAELLKILEETKRQGLTIICGRGGGQMKIAAVRRRLQKFAKEMGVKVVPHGLRKNAVNSLLEAGCSIGETAAISGQSLQMVEHYAKRRATAKMGSAAILKWEGQKKIGKTFGKPA